MSSLSQALPGGLVLRPATNADGPAVQELIFSVLREFGLCPEPAATDADLADIEGSYGPRDGWFQVAVEPTSARVVGSVALLPRSAAVVELRKMYLLPPCRGRGLGRALLEAALAEARRAGYATVVLETAAALEKAVRMYRQAGFRDSDAPPHACRCEIVMSLDLADADAEASRRRDTDSHYDRVLGPIYAWMLGDFDAAVERAADQLRRLGAAATTPESDAIDLGAGNGVHTLALLRLGHRVEAVDLSRHLLDELATRTTGLPVVLRQGDLVEALSGDGPAADVLTCLGDTLTHLPSVAAVRTLLDRAAARLRPGGRLVLGFRDYVTSPAEGDARFIPVRSDADRIHTCFLEYQPGFVRVHDLVHSRRNTGWELAVGSYRKLRLAPESVATWMRNAGLEVTDAGSERGMRTLVGRR